MNKSDKSLNQIKVYIGSDHAGFPMKEVIKNAKELNFIEFLDVGTYSNSSVDYPDYAEKIGEALQKDKKAFGIGICGTGIGICLALNKIKGVYAANLNTIEEAALAMQHNDVNVITLSGRFNSAEHNIELVKTFFKSHFEGGRHQTRVDKIKKIEEKNFA